MAPPYDIATKSAVDTQHPWLGLDSFTEETQAYVYEREEELAELGRRVQRKLLTILFGQSGLGKTSILRAGIVPRLRPMGYCPVYVRIDCSALRSSCLQPWRAGRESNPGFRPGPVCWHNRSAPSVARVIDLSRTNCKHRIRGD